MNDMHPAACFRGSQLVWNEKNSPKYRGMTCCKYVGEFFYLLAVRALGGYVGFQGTAVEG